MKKRTILTTTMIAGAIGTGTALLCKQENRAKTGRKVREYYAKITNRTASDVSEENRLKMGHPDPYDIKDNEMVSEGALYTVQHYNERY